MIADTVRCDKISNKIIVYVELDRNTLDGLLRLNLLDNPTILKLLYSFS